MKRKRTSPIWEISKEDLISLIDKSVTVTEILAHFSLKNVGNNYRTLLQRVTEDGISWDKFKQNYRNIKKNRVPKQAKDIKLILVENSDYQRWHLKNRLIKEGLLEDKCSKCGLGTEWQNEKLSLQLEHKNGIGNDNRLENLCLLCPNCHSQTKTFSGRKKRIIPVG